METRERVLKAAAELLATGGWEAMSTRAVSAAAGVQAPTLYRLFGDKAGLLAAVADHGWAAYLERKKKLAPSGDLVEDMRRGWDQHVEFGLDQPHLYTLMYGDVTVRDSAAGHTAAGLLEALVVRAAEAGRLRMSVARAVDVISAMCSGVTLTLIRSEEPDLEVSATVREAALRATITGLPEQVETAGVASRAVTLRAALPPFGETPLSPAEHGLLVEWLDRLADHTG